MSDLDDFSDSELDEDLGPSKSQVKRDMHDLQTLGLNIAALPPSIRSTISLPDTLYRAIEDYLSIKSNRAKKRQAQYIGKQMRRLDDVAEIEAAYLAIVDDKQHIDASFHLCERWRERLITEDKQALTDFLHEYPLADRQHLRHLIQKAKFERQKAQPLGHSKTLFRYLKELI